MKLSEATQGGTTPRTQIAWCAAAIGGLQTECPPPRYIGSIATKSSTLTAMARGIVTTHPMAIFASIETLRSAPSLLPRRRLATPTPMIEPTRQCDVETARPSTVLESTATAVPICTANERDGVSLVILLPTVRIVRSPRVTMPRTKPTDPRVSTHRGISGCWVISPPETTSRMAARGPIELPG